MKMNTLPEARNVAASIVTAVLGGDYREANITALANDHVLPDVALMLAGLVAEQMTPEEWRARLLSIAAHDAEEGGEK